jgi:serine phosphatase RsbU (regulator of sigma subunit)/streptogramin lyase
VRKEVRPRFLRYIYVPEDPSTLGDNTVWATYEDRAGSLWVGTDGGGLNRLDRRAGTFERFCSDHSNPGSLSDNSVRSIFQDHSGTLWVGTNVGGLNTWNPRRRKFVTYTVQNDTNRSIGSNWIHAVHEDRRGKVWIGSSAPVLDICDPSTGVIRHFPMPGSVEALYEQPTGQRMWVGSRNGLLEVDIDSLQFRKVEFAPPDPDTLSSRRVRVLESDRSGNLWIGFFRRGIAVFHPGDRSITRYMHDPADPGTLSDNFVRAIHQDRSGTMWVGTYGGLDKFDPTTQRFVHYRHNPAELESLSNDNILSIFEFPADSGNVLWVGTFGGGLNRLDTRTGRVRRYTTREGLPNNVIYGILGDTKGRIWVTTNRGMARVTPATGNVQIFDVSDGLQGNEFSTGAYHAGRSGMMFVGGVGGLSLFHPDRIEASNFVPPMVITAVRKLDQPLTFGTSFVELGPGDKYLTLEFAALDFANPSKNQYAYRLRGFDDTWTMSGSRRSATFTNLDPGEYMFEVKGSNSDGVWNERPVTLRVVVVPPFWKTRWFILLTVASALIMGYLAYRRRLAAGIEKARIVDELQAARSVQLGLLPGSDPVIDGLDISGVCIPAMEVGGDFFEYLGIDPGHSRLTVALGDVSGKGMNAAMTAVMAIGMLHRESEIAMSPAGILRHINATLYMKTDKRLFVAMLLASFDSVSRTMTFANGGQSLPIRRRGVDLRVLTGKGDRFPLGVMEHAEYEDCAVDLQPGDILVFTTDGVADARRDDGSFFDDAGIERVIRELPGDLPARDMVQRIITAVQEFTGNQHLHDDVTIVVAKVLPTR